MTQWARRLGGSRLLRLFGTAVGLLLLAHGIALRQAAAVVGHADARLVLLGLAVTAAGLSCSVVAWASAVGAVGGDVPLRRVASLYLQGLFVGHLTPTGAGGDATRAAGVSRSIGTGRGVASMAASRLATGLGMAVWGFLGAVLAHVDFGVPVVIGAAAYLAGMLVVWWLALGARGVTRWLHRSQRRLARGAGRAVAPVAEALAGFRETPRALVRVVALAAAGWLLNIFALQTLAAAVGVHQPPSLFAVAVPLSLIATLAPFAINGIGLREGVLVGLLVHVGVSATRAAALALIVDVQLVPFALVGAALFLRARGRRVEVPAPVAA